MPPYAGLPDPDLRAMVSYLSALGVAEREARRKP
jgi:hypothetical protein